MRHRFSLLCLLCASIAFATGGCVVAAPPPAVVVAPAPFVWVGPGFYGGVYYRVYPGPGHYARHGHNWR